MADAWRQATRPGDARRTRRWRGFRAGDVLMREGEPTDFLGVVLDGRLGLRLRVPERGPVTILTVEPGDVVGWSAVVPPFRATSTVVALTDSELAYFDGRHAPRGARRRRRSPPSSTRACCSAVSRRLEGTRLQLLDLFGAALGRAVVMTEPVYFLPRPELRPTCPGAAGGGREVIGPHVRDGAVMLDEIDVGGRACPSASAWSTRPASARLIERDDDRVFDQPPGPSSWKRWTFPPRVTQTVWTDADDAADRAVGESATPRRAQGISRRPRLRDRRVAHPGSRSRSKARWSIATMPRDAATT